MHRLPLKCGMARSAQGFHSIVVQLFGGKRKQGGNPFRVDILAIL